MKRKNGGVVIYQAKNGAIEFRGDLSRETIWATQAQIAEVFGVDRSVVTKHIRNILKDGEINEKSNVQKMHIANSDKPVATYPLDIILRCPTPSVGQVAYYSRFFESLPSIFAGLVRTNFSYSPAVLNCSRIISVESSLSQRGLPM